MDLTKNPSIQDYQALVKNIVKERGFDKETVPEVFMLLTEEVGEFAKAARKANGMSTDPKSQAHSVDEEAADILWLLLDICNRLDIDLAEAFQAKELKNRKRVWS